MKLNLAFEQVLEQEQAAEIALDPEVQGEVQQVEEEAQTPRNDILDSAEQQLEEMVQARVENDIEETDEAVAEGQDVAERSAEIGNEIQKDNAEGGLSLESIALAQFALNHTTRPTGMEIDLMGVGLESLDPNSRHQVAMEGLGEFLGRVGETLANLVKSAIPELGRALSIAGERVAQTRREYAELIGEAHSLRGQRATGEYRIIGSANTIRSSFARDLSVGGRLNGVVSNSMLDLLSVAYPIAAEFEEKANQAFNVNLKLARSVQYDTMENFQRSYRNAATSFVDPRKGLPGNLTRRFAGETIYFADTDAKYTGSNADAKRFDTYATKAVPTRILQRRIDTPVTETEIVALTPEEIIKVSNQVVKFMFAAGARRTWWDVAITNPGTNIIAFPIKIYRRLKIIDPGTGGIRSQVTEERRALARALDISNYMRFRVRLDAVISVLHVAYAYRQMARRSLKAVRRSNAAL